jgi:hypothetical protein
MYPLGIRIGAGATGADFVPAAIKETILLYPLTQYLADFV